MTGSSRNADPQRAAAALAVVEALYAFADEPARWDDVIAAIHALPAPFDGAQDDEANRILGHAARAAAMVDRLNAGRPAADGEIAAWDAILLSTEGRVRAVAGNAVTRLMPFLIRPLAEGEPPALVAASRKSVSDALASIAQGGALASVPFTLDSEDGEERCFGLALPREIFPGSLAKAFGLGEAWAEPLLAMVFLLDRSSGVLGDSVARKLGLTAAEARLAAKIAQGLSTSDAARELNVSVLTARTYLKDIFAKTGTHSQGQLIRLMKDLSRFPQGSNRLASSNTPLSATPRRFATMPDGRQVFYREFGDTSGHPVLYFHVGLSASLVLPELARSAERSGARVIAFERPGFGQSTPRADYTFESVAHDAERLLQELGIDDIVLFGDGFGSAFAVAAAHRLKGRVRKLALRSPALGRSLVSERSMVLSTMYRHGWIMRAVGELAHRGMRVSFIRALMRYNADRSSADAEHVADPEFSDYFFTSVYDAFERSGAGLSSELQLFGSGVRADPTGLACPIGVWHGEDHPTLPVKDTVDTFGEHPNATVHILKNTGGYFGRKEFDEMFRWLMVPYLP